jgi:hypothetical protein
MRSKRIKSIYMCYVSVDLHNFYNCILIRYYIVHPTVSKERPVMPLTCRRLAA